MAVMSCDIPNICDRLTPCEGLNESVFCKNTFYIDLTPSEYIIIRGPYKRTTGTKLKLSNKLNRKVAFRIMCTIPKMYCIRPHIGFIPAFKNITIEILFLPTELRNPAHYPSKHRFLIQTLGVCEKDDMHAETIWKHACPESIRSTKMGVLFIPDPQREFTRLRNEYIRLREQICSISKLNNIIMVFILIFLIIACLLGIMGLQK